MSKVVDKATKAVSTAVALYTVLGVKVDVNDAHGDVDSVKVLGFIPAFRRDADGKARIFGIRARRLDR